jgi:hypothetical protein
MHFETRLLFHQFACYFAGHQAQMGLGTLLLKDLYFDHQFPGDNSHCHHLQEFATLYEAGFSVSVAVRAASVASLAASVVYQHILQHWNGMLGVGFLC